MKASHIVLTSLVVGLVFIGHSAVGQADTAKAQTQTDASKKIVKPALNWKWRLSGNFGWSWRTAPMAPNLNSFQREYFKNLKSGYAMGGDAEYYFGDYYGAGIKYNLYRSEYSVMASAQTSPGIYINGELSDDISIEFIGPKFCVRVPSDSKFNSLLFGVSIGYIGYTDHGGFGPITGTIKGNSVGLVYEAGYDIGLTPHLAFGINLNYVMGALSEYEITTGGTTTTVKLDKEHYEGLSHFDILFGLRLR